MSPCLGSMPGVFSFASHVLKYYRLLGGGPRMGETLVYGGVEGGGTHSTVMIFDKVNI